MTTRPTIAYLTGEFPRASDTFIQREVSALRSYGFKIETFAVRRPGPEHKTGPERQAIEDTTTYLLELLRGGRFFAALASAALGSPTKMLSALRLAMQTRRPGVKGTVFQFIYLAEAMVLAKELRDRQVQHLHNHLADSSCTVAMLTSELSGIPFSFTLHGPGIFFEPYTWHLGTKLDRALFCATISNFARSQAAIFAQPETMKRVHIVHCGIEADRLGVVEHKGPATRLIYVGRLVELKGLSILLETVAHLRTRHPDLSLTVVGDGPDRTRFERRSAELGIADSVRFVGSQSQDDVAALLAESDVFVLPSFAEGVPVVIMEAMGSGLPVVSTYVGGIAELIEDGINGYLVPPGDQERLLERLNALIDSPQLRSQLGKSGLKKVLEHFDSTVEAGRLGALFEASLSGSALAIRPGPLPEGSPRRSDPES